MLTARAASLLASRLSRVALASEPASTSGPKLRPSVALRALGGPVSSQAAPISTGSRRHGIDGSHGRTVMRAQCPTGQRRLGPTVVPSTVNAFLRSSNVFPAAVSPSCRPYSTTPPALAKKAKTKKTEANAGSGNANETKEQDQPSLQHQEWVEFQKSIAVEGFQTGQITTAVSQGKGGSSARYAKRQREREQELQRLQKQELSSMKFPAIRYSEEETQKLLAEAYATLPKRDGKRGTRNLRRQNRRWFLVRKIHAKQKRNLVLAHERRMERRHQKREAVKAMKHDIAPQQREDDLEYQRQVLERWATHVVGSGNDDRSQDNLATSNVD